MTTAPALSTAPHAVHSIHGQHKAYLEIVPNGDGIRVQRTEQGKRALNRFWTMWLRKLILDQAPRNRGYAIEVRNNCVVITADASPDAIVGTVSQIAAQLHPLNDPPMYPSPHDFGKRELRYELKFGSRYVPWALIVDSIMMPRGIRLELCLWNFYPEDPEGRIILTRPIDHKLSPSQTGMLLELEVALACSR